ncbi:hypothetical protein [Streptomyces tremellae]|uniref:Glucose-6-phosphate dehydrogenase C-terminal domain-containing protein n=1 Tax=Streptomyces tremellae TaxID=1124239 RepID=A0ABP7EB16_9ACTN
MPFLLRTGKCLGATRRVVAVGFHRPPRALFAVGDGADLPEPVFELTDEPAVRLEVRAGEPGTRMRVGRAAVEARLDEVFERARPP